MFNYINAACLASIYDIEGQAGTKYHEHPRPFWRKEESKNKKEIFTSLSLTLLMVTSGNTKEKLKTDALFMNGQR